MRAIDWESIGRVFEDLFLIVAFTGPFVGIFIATVYTVASFLFN